MDISAIRTGYPLYSLVLSAFEMPLSIICIELTFITHTRVVIDQPSVELECFELEGSFTPQFIINHQILMSFTSSLIPFCDIIFWLIECQHFLKSPLSASLKPPTSFSVVSLPSYLELINRPLRCNLLT